MDTEQLWGLMSKQTYTGWMFLLSFYASLLLQVLLGLALLLLHVDGTEVTAIISHLMAFPTPFRSLSLFPFLFLPLPLPMVYVRVCRVRGHVWGAQR